MEIGIVGLPNVGKSTLFNALARANAAASNYPYCTIEPNVACVEVNDPRLDTLEAIARPKKLTHPLLRFVDIAGLARGASKGEGLGNLFLSHIRTVDAVAHTVRCFRDGSVVHVEGQVDPRRDVEIVESELLLSDIEMIDRRMSKVEKLAKSGDAHARREHDFLAGIAEVLNSGRRYEHRGQVDQEMEAVYRDINLLSAKPVLFVANAEEDLASQEVRLWLGTLAEIARERGTVCVPICAKLEAEMGELTADERAAMLAEMGFADNALDRFVRACYDLLQVITFFTIKGEETRGWTVRRGTSVRDAARKIHTDMYEKFVCAEVLGFEDLVAHGGMAHAREKGLVRTEGKGYEVKDGDIVLVKFGK